jgi:hypothetical protein
VLVLHDKRSDRRNPLPEFEVEAPTRHFGRLESDFGEARWTKIVELNRLLSIPSIDSDSVEVEGGLVLHLIALDQCFHFLTSFVRIIYSSDYHP